MWCARQTDMLRRSLTNHPRTETPTDLAAGGGVAGGGVLGRSSSAAKKAEAAFRISLARRSSVTSLRRALISAISSLVLPGLTSPSISACRNHFRNDSVDVMPSFAGTEPIAAASSDSPPVTPSPSAPRVGRS